MLLFTGRKNFWKKTEVHGGWLWERRHRADQSLVRWPSFLKYRQTVLEKSVLFSLSQVTTNFIVVMGSSPSFSLPLSSSSPSAWATIWSYVPFSRYAKLIDLFECGGILANSKLSIMCWALSPNARSAYSVNYSTKSENDFVFQSKVSLCHLCLAVARDSIIRYFHQITMRTSSRVRLLRAFMLPNVCKAFFANLRGSGWFSLLPSFPVKLWAFYGRGLQIVQNFHTCLQR